MPTTIAPNVELPDGYALLDRLGSGGYGEVWRATAPGGVEKAIKIVYGQCNEDLAERELKSLERIRAVRHPFVLSLERFEVVGGRLLIVTELADMSLDECFQRYCREGREGIPRDELLGYLADAAEALDCLVERHSLQHLDIKPENLLVVGDHVKVADFGLVKELATRTLNSMMGGMTPLYSAPEVFDDRPSPRSDQYSLAIVYQQMLTGKLPFPGRTPAQLAKQHTQAEPNLQPLSESDRRIVRRALAKKPEARFATCGEFLRALRSGELDSPHRSGYAGSAAPPRRDAATDDDTKSSAALHTEPVRPAGTPAPPPQVAPVLEYPVVPDEVTDIAPPAVDLAAAAPGCPTLHVAVGGLGIKMLQLVRGEITAAQPDRLAAGDLSWLAIDTDRDTLNALAGAQPPTALPAEQTLHLPLKRPKQYRDESQNLLRWVSRRWLYNIPRSLQTRGYRPLGRIAVVDHAELVFQHLHYHLQELAAGRLTDQPIRVVLLTGMTGGTGSGMVIDMAQAVRATAGELGAKVRVEVVLAAPERTPGTADSLAIANMYSLLTEIDHVQRHGNRGGSCPPGTAARYEADRAPFDEVYVVPIPSRSYGEQQMRTFASIGQYLTLTAATPAAAVLDACRQATAGQPHLLRTFASTTVSPSISMAENLQRAEPDVLACGHQRQSVLLAAEGERLPQAAELRAERETLGVYTVDLPAAHLVCEASGLQPVHLAARMAETYPDIADAASRLHAREDIDWRDLRAVDQ